MMRVLPAGLALLAAAALLSPPLRAEELGRLFFTPEQRQDMDRRRANNVQAAAAATAADLVTVNGRVTRQNGESTTWINGSPQDDLRGDISSDRITIRSADAPPVEIRVGETLDRTKGQKSDLLQGGTVSVRQR